MVRASKESTKKPLMNLHNSLPHPWSGPSAAVCRTALQSAADIDHLTATSEVRHLVVCCVVGGEEEHPSELLGSGTNGWSVLSAVETRR
jgi:hypothetical protein